MKKENAFLQKLDKIGNLTQVVCLSLFLTGVSVQGVSAETGFPISQSVQQTKTVTDIILITYLWKSFSAAPEAPAHAVEGCGNRMCWH